MQQNNPRLTSKEAAAYIPTTEANLRDSRVSGLLFGIPAPKHLKMGRRVFYQKNTLDAWLAQFEERSSTSEGA